MTFNKEMINELRCPGCLDKLVEIENFLSCQNTSCRKRFPIVNGIPILINEEMSVFNIQDFFDQKETTFKVSGKLDSIAKKIIPSISNNIKAKANYKKLLTLILGQTPQPKVLVIGGSILGEGIEDLITEPKINLVESDVTFGPRTQIIFDAHDIPFPNEFFDCVIIQAVLEHVIDPQRCVK